VEKGCYIYCCTYPPWIVIIRVRLIVFLVSLRNQNLFLCLELAEVLLLDFIISSWIIVIIILLLELPYQIVFVIVDFMLPSLSAMMRVLGLIGKLMLVLLSRVVEAGFIVRPAELVEPVCIEVVTIWVVKSYKD